MTKHRRQWRPSQCQIMMEMEKRVQGRRPAGRPRHRRPGSQHPTIKPIDTEFIESIASSHGKIVTVEDHGISSGLGSTVAEAVAELGRGRVRRVGVTEFAESGDAEGLYGKYGLSAHHISAAAVS